LDVDGAQLASPLYVAVAEWVPAVSVLVVNVAFAGEPLTGCGARGLPSMTNVAVPVAVVLPLLQVTVAVKVTGWPTVDGFGEDSRAVVVPAGLTAWLTVLEVLPALLMSPL
jgi:hypothetical protein